MYRRQVMAIADELRWLAALQRSAGLGASEATTRGRQAAVALAMPVMPGYRVFLTFCSARVTVPPR